MHKSIKNLLSFIFISLPILGLSGCNGNDEIQTLKISYPDGTPALAIARFPVDTKSISSYELEYNLVSASLIASEMANASSDLVIMPINAGANLIRQGASYKLASVAVDGSLFVIGKDGVNSLTDLKGKTLACIGQQGIPGLVTRYVLTQNGISIVSDSSQLTDDNIYIQYVADGSAARTLLAGGNVDYALVGEPAATAISTALSSAGISIKLNMQDEYKNAVNISGVTTYPQAGLFIKSELSKDSKFLNSLYEELKSSKEWVINNPGEVTETLKEHLSSTSTFPPSSINNCAINGNKIDEVEKQRVIEFLNRLMPIANSSWLDIDLFC